MTGKLAVSSRELARWPFATLPPCQVRSFDGTMNRFTQIPMELTRLRNLRDIDLSANRIVKIPDSIQGLVQLEELNLSMNRVRFISDGLCALTQLRSLIINGGCLEKVPHHIGRLSHLRRLLLGDELAAIPASLGNCRELRLLILRKNRLSYLPPELGMLEKLIDLRVDNNLLEVWPVTFRHLRSLRWLHAHANPLRHAPWFALALPDIRAISCCDFLIPKSEAARFTQACAERSIVLRWNRSLWPLSTDDCPFGEDDFWEAA